MPNYSAPGIYIQEVPSAIQPIAGVSTSVAGFIGIIPEQDKKSITLVFTADRNNKEFNINREIDKDIYEVEIKEVKIDGKVVKEVKIDGTGVIADKSKNISQAIKGGDKIGEGASGETTTTLSASNEAKGYKQKTINKQINLELDDAPQNSSKIEVTISYKIQIEKEKLSICTSLREFEKNFLGLEPGDEKKEEVLKGLPEESKYFYHAVYGFFNNGGSQCYVIYYPKDINIAQALEQFSTVENISIIAAPGITEEKVQTAILDHCKNEKRFAILDCKKDDTTQNISAKDNDFGAIYYPWIKVGDLIDIQNKEPIAIPPSGHIAGVYARVDSERGVYKAPANEVILGALDVTIPLTSAAQEKLNPKGINAIRVFNNTVKIWGARTMGGDSKKNAEFKYIGTRRLYNFLRKSIEQGTQFAVFEPNTPVLWQRITQNVSDFLLGQWRDGALFGDDPKKAFFVKCDAETNPSDVRKRGQVITEIGVAIVKPAEFVIFRIQQITGG